MQSPLAAADEIMSLRIEYGIEISADSEIANGHEPRFDPQQDFRRIRGLTGRVTKAIYQTQFHDAVDRLQSQKTAARAEAGRRRREDPERAQRLRKDALSAKRG